VFPFTHMAKEEDAENIRTSAAIISNLFFI
jgi:hypothetical protein